MIVVLDTNCLVAGLLSPNGPCAEILDRWRDGQFEVAVSSELVAELQRTLQYPRIVAKYHVTASAVDAVADELKSQGVMFADSVAPPRVVPGDSHDDYVIALAVAADGHLLVTRDKHFAEVDRNVCAVEIISPEQFLGRLREDNS